MQSNHQQLGFQLLKSALTDPKFHVLSKDICKSTSQNFPEVEWPPPLNPAKVDFTCGDAELFESEFLSAGSAGMAGLGDLWEDVTWYPIYICVKYCVPQALK